MTLWEEKKSEKIFSFSVTISNFTPFTSRITVPVKIDALMFNFVNIITADLSSNFSDKGFVINPVSSRGVCKIIMSWHIVRLEIPSTKFLSETKKGKMSKYLINI